MTFTGIRLPERSLEQEGSVSLLRAAALGQGVFYAVTGFWPVVHIRSFEAVSGPKHDDWLVKTVGLLLTVIGCVLSMAGMRRRMGIEIPLLGVGSALSLAAIDLVYVSRRRIPPIYLADAAGEGALASLWAIAWFWKPSSKP